jgi:hypothetical protein
MAGGYAKIWFGLNTNFDFNCDFLCLTICVHFEFLVRHISKSLLKSPYCKKQKWSIQPPPGNELKAKLYDTPIFRKVDRTQRGRGHNFAHIFRSLKHGQKWMDRNSFSSFPKSHWYWACAKISAKSDDRLLKYRAPKCLLTSAENRPNIGQNWLFYKKFFIWHIKLGNMGKIPDFGSKGGVPP